MAGAGCPNEGCPNVEPTVGVVLAARLNEEGWVANAENPPPLPVLVSGVVLLPKADSVLLKALNAPEAGLISDDDPKAEGCPNTEDVAGG